MSNREVIEGALKRVNALLEETGCKGKLFKDDAGWFVIWRKSHCIFDASAMNAGEMLAYLHGVEDTLLFIKYKQL